MGTFIPTGAKPLIRVLEVIPTLKRAGAETMMTDLVCGLEREQFTPGVAALFDASPGDLEGKVRACEAPMWRLGKRRGPDLRMFGRLRRVFREFQPDIIHTHSYVMRYVLPVATCPIVHTVHNLASEEVDTVGKLVHRMAWRRGAIPVAVGEQVATSFRQLYGMDSETIPNGIDLQRFSDLRNRNEWRETHGFVSEDVLILSLGRLEPQKNPALLLEAFGRLPTQCHLLVAGDGTLRSLVEGKPRVHALGVQGDVTGVLAAADIFALSSDWEGNPIALMEAMAAGLPVVATAVGGVPGIVDRAGILVERGNADKFAEALTLLAENSSARKIFREAAVRRAGQFDLRVMVDSYAALFQRVERRS